MNKTFTCILCPNGCEVTAEFEDGKVLSVAGNKSSVLVEGGDMPLVSVRLSGPIPKGKIMDVMGEIKKMSVTAPVHMGDVVIPNVLGLGRDVIATRDVETEE